VNQINQARMGLVDYMSDKESEAAADKISYWNYGRNRPDPRDSNT
jgi:hypothetical protein